jgi:hypothetical protein
MLVWRTVGPATARAKEGGVTNDRTWCLWDSWQHWEHDTCNGVLWLLKSMAVMMDEHGTNRTAVRPEIDTECIRRARLWRYRACLVAKYIYVQASQEFAYVCSSTFGAKSHARWMVSL